MSMQLAAGIHWLRDRLSRQVRTRRNRVVRKVFARPLGAGCERLESRDLLAVTFHGGQLLQNVEAQAVYLGSDWKTSAPLKNQTAAVDQFMSYLVQSPYMDMLTQAGYGVGRGTATTGVVSDININKSAGITDAQIQADLQSAISSSQLAAPNANRLYVVYVEPGVVVKDGRDSSATSFLGYHGAFAGRDAGGELVDIRYEVIPYPGSPNPSAGSQGFASTFDQLTSVTSHELAEAVTDPNVNYKASGWYDDRLNGEIGDLTHINTRLNGYLVQDAVDKNDRPIAPSTSSSGQSPPISPPVTPAPPVPPVTPTLPAFQNIRATALSPTDAQLTWDSVAGAGGYRIFLVNGSQTSLLGTVGASTTSVKITGLTPGATATLQVEAYRSAAVSDSASASVQMPAPVSSPSGLTAPLVTPTMLSATVAQLSWGAVAGAVGYNIYWWDGTQAVLLGSVGASVTSVQISGLTRGASARFFVEAFNNNASAASDWVSVTAPTYPGHRWHR